MNAPKSEDGLILVELPIPARRTLSGQAATYPGLTDEVYASNLLCAALDAAAQMAQGEAAPPAESEPAPQAPENHVVRMRRFALALTECRQLTNALLGEFQAYGLDTSEENREHVYLLTEHLCGESGELLATQTLERLGFDPSAPIEVDRTPPAPIEEPEPVVEPEPEAAAEEGDWGLGGGEPAPEVVLEGTHSVHVLNDEEDLRQALRRAAEFDQRTADLLLSRSAHYRELLAEPELPGAE